MTGNSFTKFLLIAIALFFMVSLAAYAQQDTLDVAPGYETLNIAVEGDTTATGDYLNPNRVYRLQRGEVYLLNGSIYGVKGGPVRIVAAKGDGPRPIIISAADESGTAVRAFALDGDGYFEDLYISGINNLGFKFKKDMFRLFGDNAKVVIDNCFCENEAQAFIRCSAPGQNIRVTNSIMRNSFTLADPYEGFIMYCDSQVDSLYFQNNTFYRATYTGFDDRNNIILYAFFDHNTMYELGASSHDAIGVNFDRAVDLTITNNLIYDFGFSGAYIPADTNHSNRQIISLSELNAPDVSSDSDRHITISNNVYGWSQPVIDWIDTKEDLELYNFMNGETQALIDSNGWVAENNMEEQLTFENAPDPAVAVNFVDYRYTSNNSNENNPDIAAQMLPQTDDPTTWGTASPREYSFNYGATAQAYTYAERGFPVGDLNWYPDLMPLWESGGTVGVKRIDNQVPTSFSLSQNYPNPFNPTTTINYMLPKSGIVTLKVFNALGEEISTLVNNEQAAGSYKVTFDASRLASGVYFYRLETGNFILTKKMILMK